MASTAVATPSSLMTFSDESGSFEQLAYRSDLFPKQLSSVNLLLVGRCSQKGIGERVHRKLSDARPHTQRLHSVGPEELITKERLDDCWQSSYKSVSKSSLVGN